MENSLLGYLIIPTGINREDYIKSCFDKELFAVMTNNKGCITDVLCLKQILNDLEFPIDDIHLGSEVILNYLDKYHRYIIIGTISKQGESNFNNEQDLKFSKTLDNSSVGVVGNTFLSRLYIFCKNVASKIANLIIEVKGSKDSKLSLNSSGWVCIKTETGFKILNGIDKGIYIDKDKISINNSIDQNLILSDNSLIYQDGNKNKLTIDSKGYSLGNINFQNYITEILDFINNQIVLNTPMGPSAPGVSSTTSGASLIKIKEELENINK